MCGRPDDWLASAIRIRYQCLVDFQSNLQVYTSEGAPCS